MRRVRLRHVARRAARRTAEAGRALGVLPYRPERWSTEQWTRAYGGGHLDYYATLPELARYSLLVGYVGWVASQRLGRSPSVLDVGCGRGLLRERLGSQPLRSYVGVDLSVAAVAAAAARGYDGSTFVVGDLAELDLEPADVVVLNEVLYYAPDPRRFLERVADLVAPGGVVLLSVWRHPGDRRLWRTVASSLRMVDVVHVRDPGNQMNPRGWRVACCEVRAGS